MHITRFRFAVQLRITTLIIVFLFALAEASGPQEQVVSPEQMEDEKPEGSLSEKPEESNVNRIRLGGPGFVLTPGDDHIQTGKASHKPEVSPLKSRKNWEFAVAPIPVVNPTVGNGLAGVGAFLVRLDKEDHVSPPSVFGGGAGYTDNGTWAWSAIAELYLKEDRFRILGKVGTGKVNYDYYGTGQVVGGESGLFILISLDAFFFLAEPKMRMFKNWYLGPRFQILDSKVGLNYDELKVEFPNLPEIDLPEFDVKVKSVSLGLRIERDTKDSQFYPRKGSLFDTKIDFFDTAFGSQRDYQNVEIAFQGYFGFKGKNVIAYRGSVCSASENAPFYGLCQFGQSKDIRGYSIGRFQDHRMAVGQIEYRRELFWRLGGVAYFGAGQVAETFSRFSKENFLPGGGIGARFTLAKDSHINFRVDYAWGKDSNGIYIGIVEAF